MTGRPDGSSTGGQSEGSGDQKRRDEAATAAVEERVCWEGRMTTAVVGISLPGAAVSQAGCRRALTSSPLMSLRSQRCCFALQCDKTTHRHYNIDRRCDHFGQPFRDSCSEYVMSQRVLRRQAASQRDVSYARQAFVMMVAGSRHHNPCGWPCLRRIHGRP